MTEQTLSEKEIDVSIHGYGTDKITGRFSGYRKQDVKDFIKKLKEELEYTFIHEDRIKLIDELAGKALL